MTVIDALENILDMPKLHKPERAVKSLISSNFYIDGNLFIERFDLVFNSASMNNRNFRAKTIVDLAMSLECSMKSLIMSLSKDDETPVASYKRLRKLSHNLSKLYLEVGNRAKNRFKIPKKNEAIFNDLQKLGVGSRYSYEIWLLRFQSNAGSAFFGDTFINNTVDDRTWAADLRNEAAIFNNAASNCRSKFLSKHGIMSGERFSAYENALNIFLNGT